MAAAIGRGGGSRRVLAKLRASVEAGDYYEAHQLYRTIYFRYLGQNRYGELLDLLYEGATTLLTHNQQHSGTDLSVLFIEVLEKSQQGVSEEILMKLGSLHGLMTPDNAERHKYLVAAIRWSSKGSSQGQLGHPLLHQAFANNLWREKNYAGSRYHFLHSGDGEGCASMLIEYHMREGYPSEVDLFIAQTVFQYLCLRNKCVAHSVFFCYTLKHPDIKSKPPFIFPLLNFLWLLLMAIEGGRLTVFSILCDKYKPSLCREPLYLEYLDRIGQIFFGLPPPRTRPTSILDNLMQSLLGGSGGDDSDGEMETEEEEESGRRQRGAGSSPLPLSEALD